MENGTHSGLLACFVKFAVLHIMRFKIGLFFFYIDSSRFIWIFNIILVFNLHNFQFFGLLANYVNRKCVIHIRRHYFQKEFNPTNKKENINGV